MAVFYFLSFFFQLLVSVISYWNLGYARIFTSYAPDDMTYEEAVVADSKDTDPFQKPKQWCYNMLTFNYYRFIEYTFSGSLVLATVALVSGIYDLELLLCILLLSGACMLLGLVAEFAMRCYTVTQKVHMKMDTLGFEKTDLKKFISYILQMLADYMWWTFYISHVLAWLCIILPWYIIFMRYMSWWKQECGSGTSGSNAGKRVEPPDFVNAIVYIQVILYLSFGLVQTLQWFWPHKRRAAEIAYISLSISAKFLLGVILAANVLR